MYTPLPGLIDYVQRLLQYTRDAPGFSYGVSPRGGLALLRCARCWAWLDGRDHLVPEDVQAVLEAVVGHRVRAAEDVAGHESRRLVSGADGGGGCSWLTHCDHGYRDVFDAGR